MTSPAPRRLDPCPCGSGKRYKDCHGSLSARARPEGFDAALALHAQGRLDEAIALLDARLAVAPREPALLTLRGYVRHELMRLDAALADFDAAIAVDPGFAEAHYNRGAVLLLRGDYAAGWPEYEWRTRMPGYADYANFPFGMPRWHGEGLAGKSLIVHAEQGQGDTIQFARFIKRLADAGATIDVFCHEPLVSIMGRIPGVRHAMARLRERPTHDFHAPAIDLGIAALPTAQSAHWFGAYVSPLPDRVGRFAGLLREAPRPIVGIAWKGSPRHANDANRSLACEAALALSHVGASRVNLQLGEPPLDAAMIDASRDIADWEDTAAVVSMLDRVVTVDTAVAHLAGAMGKPVTLLVPFCPDWRWRERGDETPWYPSMRLVRQSRRGDWSEALAKARESVREH